MLEPTEQLLKAYRSVLELAIKQGILGHEGLIRMTSTQSYFLAEYPSNVQTVELKRILKTIQNALRRNKGEVESKLRATIYQLDAELQNQLDERKEASRKTKRARSIALAGALHGDRTPIGQVPQMVYRSLDWRDDSECPSKAYIFACLSELAYTSIGKEELRGGDRYRVIPSLLLQELIKDNFTIHIDHVLEGILGPEINATVLDTGAFIMIIYTFTEFTVIAIRGTTWRLSDWITDLDIRKVELNGLGYHGGFYRDAMIALPQLVTKVPAKDYPLYFTGHSLGGALAGLLSQLWKGPGSLMTPYTFGSPRFGDGAVAKNGKVYAYVRALDPVPHLPFKQMGFRSSGWPPTVIPTGDHWLSGWKLPKRWMKLIPAHGIEQYRKEIGEECSSTYFPVQVYCNVLRDELVRSTEPDYDPET